MQFVKIVNKEHFKTRRAKPLVRIVLLDGLTKEMGLLVAMLFLLDHTLWKELRKFVNVVTHVKVQIRRKNPAEKVRTPTTRAPSPAFPVHRVKFPRKKGALNAMNAPRGIYNLIRKNQYVLQSKLDQSLLEDLPR